MAGMGLESNRLCVRFALMEYKMGDSIMDYNAGIVSIPNAVRNGYR